MDVAHSSTSLPARRRPDPWKRLVIGVGVVIGVPALVFFIVANLIFRNFTVPTGSMENSVLTGDRILVERGWEPRRGDIIAFIYPGDRDQIQAEEFQYRLNRCVAIAGDTVALHGGKVYVGEREQPLPPGVKFDQAMSAPVPGDDFRTFPDGARFTRDEWGPMRVPKKGDVIPLNDSTFYMWRIFIMREGHAAEKELGRVTIDATPATSYTVRRDYCFGIGDNRYNSLDSRYWGFIPVDDVAGRPRWVYWSKEEGGPIRWDRIFKSIE